MPRRSIYGASQSTNKRGQKQTRLHFAETNYLRSSQREPKFFDPQPCGAVGTRKRFGNRRRSSWRKGTVAYIEYIKASACDRRHCGRDTDRQGLYGRAAPESGDGRFGNSRCGGGLCAKMRKKRYLCCTLSLSVMPQTVVLTLKPEEAADVHRYAPLAARAAGVAERDVALLRVVKRSIDARQRQPKVHLTLELYADGEPQPAPVHFDYPQVGHRTDGGGRGFRPGGTVRGAAADRAGLPSDRARTRQTGCGAQARHRADQPQRRGRSRLELRFRRRRRGDVFRRQALHAQQEARRLPQGVADARLPRRFGGDSLRGASPYRDGQAAPHHLQHPPNDRGGGRRDPFRQPRDGLRSARWADHGCALRRRTHRGCGRRAGHGPLGARRLRSAVRRRRARRGQALRHGGAHRASAGARRFDPVPLPRTRRIPPRSLLFAREPGGRTGRLLVLHVSGRVYRAGDDRCRRSRWSTACPLRCATRPMPIRGW